MSRDANPTVAMGVFQKEHWCKSPETSSPATRGGPNAISQAGARLKVKQLFFHFPTSAGDFTGTTGQPNTTTRPVCHAGGFLSSDHMEIMRHAKRSRSWGAGSRVTYLLKPKVSVAASSQERPHRSTLICSSSEPHGASCQPSPWQITWGRPGSRLPVPSPARLITSRWRGVNRWRIPWQPALLRRLVGVCDYCLLANNRCLCTPASQILEGGTYTATHTPQGLPSRCLAI